MDLPRISIVMDLQIGIKGQASWQVTPEVTADRVGSGGLAVFATPMMIALIEKTCYDSVQPYLAEGQGTVGTRVEVSHVAATPVGKTVTAESELVEIDRRRLVFRVSAHDDRGLIGEGTHERFIIDIDRFLAKTYGK